MSGRRLLLLSNSRNYQKGYLEHARESIREYLGEAVTRVVFVPYAGVTIDWDNYAEMAAAQFNPLGYEIEPIHTFKNAASAIEGAQAIAVGGGNTFHLLKTMIERGVLEPIRRRVLAGVPYMGWSAGSNVACPTIRTTNDMPIVEPATFDALGLVPFQINPHYTDAVLPQHQGETRADRLMEFVAANPDMPVVGLREGSILRVEGDRLALLGESDARVFVGRKEVTEHPPGDSLQFLMQR